jgi:hypothetical protein
MKLDKGKIKEILKNLTDFYADFYITKNNLRLFLKENLDLLFEAVEKGDKIYYVDGGILFVTGFSDNYDRKYLKILTVNSKIAEQLLNGLDELKTSLYIKIKKNNPIKEVLESKGFKFYKSRGKEILMIRKFNKEK